MNGLSEKPLQTPHTCKTSAFRRPFVNSSRSLPHWFPKLWGRAASKSNTTQALNQIPGFNPRGKAPYHSIPPPGGKKTSLHMTITGLQFIGLDCLELEKLWTSTRAKEGTWKEQERNILFGDEMGAFPMKRRGFYTMIRKKNQCQSRHVYRDQACKLSGIERKVHVNI